MSETQKEPSDENAVEERCPTAPVRPELPEIPSLNPVLPPRPSKVQQTRAIEGGGYGKAALASMAATSFLSPILILAVGGYMLDARMRHSTYWFAGLGVLVGLIVGTTSLMRILQKLSD